MLLTFIPPSVVGTWWKSVGRDVSAWGMKRECTSIATVLPLFANGLSWPRRSRASFQFSNSIFKPNYISVALSLLSNLVHVHFYLLHIEPPKNDMPHSRSTFSSSWVDLLLYQIVRIGGTPALANTHHSYRLWKNWRQNGRAAASGTTHTDLTCLRHNLFTKVCGGLVQVLLQRIVS